MANLEIMHDCSKNLRWKNESKGPLELKRNTVYTKDLLLLIWLWKFKCHFWKMHQFVAF